jgi:membrane associated rhomboid family serine protease
MSLSADLISKGYIWTFFTYPFIYSSTGLFDLLFHLGFNALFLWVFGIPLLERLGSKRFLILFFGATIFAGMAVVMTLHLLSSPQLFSGPTPPLFALITAWTILHGMRSVQLTQLVFRPFWIFLILVGINLALDALSGLWIQFIADASASLYAYLFCLISEKVDTSIPTFHPFERTVLRSLEKLHAQNKPNSSVKTPKIFDFKTGEAVLDDEQFMDAMLAKISEEGEALISPEEKSRMQAISKKKIQQKD